MKTLTCIAIAALSVTACSSATPTGAAPPDGSCRIDGADFAAGASDPTNACQTCLPTSSATNWSAAADGTPCASGQICAQGNCESGCIIGGAFYVATAPNPANSCEVCEPASAVGAWSSVMGAAPVGGTCASGQVCSAGACTAGCNIAGAFIAPGARAPLESCLSCQPSVSTSSWSPVSALAPDGGSCEAGEVCQSGACAPGCVVDGGFFLTGASSPANACLTCQPAISTSDFEPASGLAPDGGCATGEVCERGSCAAGCWIGGDYVASGATLPGAACLQCLPSLDTSSYTPYTGFAPDGGCAAEEVCSSGACTSGCIIDDSFVGAGQADRAHSCRSCEPAISTQVWASGFSAWTTRFPYGSLGVAVDLVGNGSYDLVVGGGDFVPYVNDGNGTFDQGTPIYATVNIQTAGVAVPYSNPPHPDVFFVGEGPGGAGSVEYAKNVGDGGLSDCTTSGQPMPCIFSTGGDSISAITTGKFAGNDAGPGLAAVALFDARIDYFVTMSSPLATLPFSAPAPAIGQNTLEFASIASGDFNGDGLDDLVLSISWDPPYQSDILLFLAQPNGTFTAAVPVATLQNGVVAGLAIADFNGDGKADLAFTDGVESIQVALGNGLGGFSAPVAYAVGSETTWLVASDFNGDGLPDLAVTTNYPPGIDVLFGEGSGTFSAPLLVYSSSAQPSSLSASDWQAPVSPGTFGSPTQILAAVDLNGDVIALTNSCQ